jgi:hypothetical protein
MSHFSETLHTQQNHDQRAAEQVLTAEGLQAELAKMSASLKGSELDRFMTDEITEICTEFLDAADQMGWPNAEEIQLRQHRLGRPIWRTPGKYQDQAMPSLVNSATTRKAGEWKGYHIANLQVGDEAMPARVMLCDDGLLRCERAQPLFTKSYGEGFGQMPDGTLIQTKGYMPLSDLSPESFANFMASKLKGGTGYRHNQPDPDTWVRQPRPQVSEALAAQDAEKEAAVQNARFIAANAGSVALGEVIDRSAEDDNFQGNDTFEQGAMDTDEFRQKVAEQLKAEIENLEARGDMDEKKIYRYMVKKYHTDVDDHEFSEAAIRFLNVYFDPRKK